MSDTESVNRRRSRVGNTNSPGGFDRLATPGTYTFVSIGIGKSEDFANARAALGQIVFQYARKVAKLLKAESHADRRVLLAFTSTYEAIACLAKYYEKGLGEENTPQLAVGISTSELQPGDSGLDSPGAAMAEHLSILAHPGQILIASTTYDLLRDQDRLDCTLLSLGTIRVDFQIRTERVFQAIVPGLPEVRAKLPIEEPAESTIPHRFGFLVQQDDVVDDALSKLTRFPLVTITGIAGIGKSHIATRIAQLLHSQQDQDVVWIDLGGIQSQSDLYLAIAAGFRLKVRTGWPIERIILRHFATRRLTMILDGCDLCIPHVRGFMRKALQLGATSRILATSATPVGETAASSVQVPYLDCPPENLPLSREELEEYGATMLFLDRFREFVSEFDTSRESVNAIAKLCRNLGGHPLSIVLAARRASKSSPQRVLADLLQADPNETSSAANLPVESSVLLSLEHTIRQLPEETLQALTSLFPLRGNWTVDDAAALADIDRKDALAAIDVLLQWGLVNVEGVRDTTEYFKLPNLVAKCIERRLVSDEQRTAILTQHGLIVLGKLAQIAQNFRGPNEVLALHQMESIAPDVTAAFEFTLGPGGSLKTFVQATMIAWPYWYKRNRIEEGLRIIDRALKRFGEKDLDKGRLLSLAGALAIKAGMADRAGKYLDQALDIGRSIKHDYLIATSLANLGTLNWSIGNLEEADRLFRESKPYNDAEASEANKRTFYQSWATTLMDSGRLEEAIELLKPFEGPEVADPLLTWMHEMFTAQYEFRKGHYENAHAGALRCLQIALDAEDYASAARSLYWIAEAEFALGLIDRATRRIGMMSFAARASGISLYRINELRLAGLEGRCRKALGTQRFQEERLSGALITLNELLVT